MKKFKTMKIRHLLYILISFLIFQSCKNDAVNELPQPDPGLDSNYIDKVYFMSQEAGMPEDTSGIWSYTYDNLKRVIKMNIAFIDEDTTNPIILRYLYYYNGSDSLPYKTVYLSFEDIVPDTITFFHSYDAAGRNLKDSTIYSRFSYEATDYSYNGNIITGNTRSTLQSTYPIIIDTAITDARGNIINNKSYRYNIYTMEWEPLTIISTTFDNKESPFAKLSNFKTFGVFPDTYIFSSIYNSPQFSNLVSQDVWASNIVGREYHLIYNNSYFANGKLKQVITHELPNGIQEKWLFTYRSL